MTRIVDSTFRGVKTEWLNAIMDLSADVYSQRVSSRMKHKAFTLIEMLVAVAIVLMLFGAMITVTGRLKNESRKRLTASAMAVVDTALEQYYENTSPKHFPKTVINKVMLETELAQAVGISPATIDAADNFNAEPPRLFWNSGSLYYFLTRVPQSKVILESLSNQMISNKDSNGTAILIKIPDTAAAGTDFVRFVDAWGTSIRYEYSGSGVPVLTSAGPDKKFNTEDDVVSQ